MAKVKRVYKGPAEVLRYEGREYRQGDVVDIEEALIKHLTITRHGNHKFEDVKETKKPSDEKKA